jgi:metal-responsive CopG/Arc/MetJ family transcriptional regulator
MNPISTANQVPSQLPRLVVYMPEEVKKKFERLSEKQRRSMSQMVVFLVEQAIEEAERAEPTNKL